MSDKQNTVHIFQDTSCDMLKIVYQGELLFYGNTWDFDRSAISLADLFEMLGKEVEVHDFKCQ